MKIINRFEEIFVGVGLLSTTLILFINVILRYFFQASSSWAEEVIRYLMIWIAFIGGSICVRLGVHVSIDFIQEYLERSYRRYVGIIINSIAILFSVTMVYQGVRFISFSRQTGQVSPALQIPMWIPYLAVPIGFTLMAVRFWQQLVFYLRSQREGELL